MAITNYTELQTAVENWLLRSSNSKVTDRIPEFIALGEAFINRQRRAQVLMAEAISDLTYAATDTDRNIALPSGFMSVVSIHLKPAASGIDSYRRARIVSPDEVENSMRTGGEPRKVAIMANGIQFDSPVSENWTVRVLYVKKWDIATDATNWLLTNAPDIYLAASMIGASTFIRVKSDVAAWKSQVLDGLEELAQLHAKTRGKGEATLDRFPGRRGGYDVISDS